MNKFSDSTIAAITPDEQHKYYVYCLVDPRDNSPFYVGKGTGNRLFEHQRMTDQRTLLEVSEEEKCSLKLDKIAAINASNKQIKSYIITHSLTEKEAYASENTLINYLGLVEKKQLTNLVSGHGAIGDSVENLEKRYGYQPIEIEDILTNELILVVKIRDAFFLDIDETKEYQVGQRDDQNLKSRTLGEWIVGKDAIKRIAYVIGVNSGANNAVVSAYRVSKEETSRVDTSHGRSRYAFKALSNRDETLKELGLYKRSLPSISFGTGRATAFINK
ncbi:hypothetical protein P7H62_09315 [Vagococcus carniphilus]|uniref:LEM-3-like GIY-YIG domain-containing protein n=1 Tax=Vagococcus carniphilus TaxID=218144 RepID=UPI0028925EAB|nr:hypothetical protein [Vagococcus carniphilus]MDT2830606.1 hypothetical protein [Vagococcus carniphilus]MDT2839905.1 hypothetical protein [Vagococcus carniphilus]MDT2854649.1 hypothetical protein [Vagococcus carniphilus]